MRTRSRCLLYAAVAYSWFYAALAINSAWMLWPSLPVSFFLPRVVFFLAAPALGVGVCAALRRKPLIFRIVVALLLIYTAGMGVEAYESGGLEFKWREGLFPMILGGLAVFGFPVVFLTDAATRCAAPVRDEQGDRPCDCVPGVSCGPW